MLTIATLFTCLVLLPLAPWLLKRLRLGGTRIIVNPYAIDGDTIISHNQRIRIWGIDAPELSQDGGFQAQHALRVMLKDRRVMVQPVAKDKYGRLVARLSLPDLGSVDIAREMIAQGFALPDSRAPRLYRRVLRAAQRRQAGLWSTPRGITSPAAHRQSQKGRKQRWSRSGSRRSA